MSFGPEDTLEVIPRRLKIEQNIAWFGAYVLAASVDITTYSTHDAEYTAIPGSGILAIGLIATVFDIYRLRRSYYFSPDDDPEREDFEPMAEVVELPSYKVLPKPEDIAA